jgi:hypothetical protein
VTDTPKGLFHKEFEIFFLEEFKGCHVTFRYIAQYRCRRCALIIVMTLLGTFTMLRKARFSFVMSARMERLGSPWKDFHEILHLNTFRKVCRENSSFINILQE